MVSSLATMSPILHIVFDTVGEPALLCVLGSHLLIHLREAAEDDRNEGTSYSLSSNYANQYEQDAESSELGKHGQFSALLQFD